MAVRAIGVLMVLNLVGAQGQTSSVDTQSATQVCGEAVIEYFSQGQGDAVVLLPGSGFGVAYLEPLAEALARGGYRAVRVNPRGAGKSTGPIDATYHARAADVNCVIKGLRLGSVHIVGHAFGNRIARTLAADQPDVVRSVVLLAAGGKVPPSPEVSRALGKIYTPAPDAELIEAVKVSGLAGKPDNAALVWQALEPSVFASSRPTAPAARPEEWWAPPGRVKFLVIQGLNDLIATPENGRSLKQELGDSAILSFLRTSAFAQ